MKLPKKTVSVSQINSFYQCPKCWYFHYIEGITLPVPSYFTFGRRVHEVIEKYHKNEDLTGYDDVINYLEVYKQVYGPEYESVEEMFEVPIIHPTTGEKLPIILNGKIDKIESEWIHDHKTSSAKWKEDGRLHNDLQFTVYSYAYRQMKKKDERGIRINVLVKRKKPYMQCLDTFRTIGDYVDMFYTISRYLRDVDELKEVPEHAMYCRNSSLFP